MEEKVDQIQQVYTELKDELRQAESIMGVSIPLERSERFNEPINQIGEIIPSEIDVKIQKIRKEIDTKQAERDRQIQQMK